MTEFTCPCGIVATAKKPTARYCSNACKYRYRVRPSGLSYRIVNDNPGWYGRHRAQLRGEAHPFWKGDAVGYDQLHDWVAQQKGPRPGRCQHCQRPAVTQWANLSHEYHRDLSDWAALCKRCHRRHDSGDARGAAARVFEVRGRSGDFGQRRAA